MYKNLLRWSQTHYHNLPWRKKRTLYSTLVSEIMLQQTTVGTVINHYSRFLKKYKNLDALASASEEQLQMDWKGLGYYRRAKNLKKAAEYMVEKYNGRFPKTIEELKEIPGIGDYTANAIIAIGRNRPALPLDANLERVLSRIYGIQEKSKLRLHKKLYALYENKEILNQRNLTPRGVSEALMDLGRELCQARKAHCALCPVQKDCLAFKSGEPLTFPGINKKEKKFFQLKLARLIIKKGDQILAYRKPKGTWLEGQLELPTLTLDSEKKNFTPYPKLKFSKNSKTKYKTSITQYKIENLIYELTVKEFEKLNFPHPCEFIDLRRPHNLSTASVKAIKKIS